MKFKMSVFIFLSNPEQKHEPVFPYNLKLLAVNTAGEERIGSQPCCPTPQYKA